MPAEIKDMERVPTSLSGEAGQAIYKLTVPAGSVYRARIRPFVSGARPAVTIYPGSGGTGSFRYTTYPESDVKEDTAKWISPADTQDVAENQGFSLDTPMTWGEFEAATADCVFIVVM